MFFAKLFDDTHPIFFPKAKPEVEIPNPGRTQWTVGSNVELNCLAQGFVNEEIRWERQDGRPLPQGHRINNGKLTLYNVQPQDGGVYICRARGDDYQIWIDSSFQIYVRGND